MTLRQAYGWGWVLVLELGLLAVLLGGELSPLFAVSMLAPVVVWPFSPRALSVPGWVGTSIATAGLAGGVLTVATRGLGAILLGGAVALVGILVGRVLSRRTLEHDVQALVLSLLLVFAGTVLHTQITYGVVFVLYAVAAVWALLTRQLVRVARSESERAGDPARFEAALRRRDLISPRFALITAGLSVLVLLTTSGLFLFFPRIGFGNLGLLAQGRDRFPTAVSLVGAPRAGAGNEVLARVLGVPYAEYAAGLYMRGPVYEHMEASAFVALPDRPLMTPSRMVLAPTSRKLQYEVFAQPVMGAVLPTLGPAERVEMLSGGQANPSLRTRVLGQGPAGEVLANGPLSGPLRYGVRGGLARPGGHRGDPRLRHNARTQAVIDRFTKLPKDLDPRIPALAADILRQQGLEGEASPADKARVLGDYLARQFTYSLEHGNGDRPDPLAGFLFEERRGHCEYFATALAALLRTTGVASRVVGGLQGGKWHGDPSDPEAVVVFTAANAHAWVEWFDPTRGWITEDATPAASAGPTFLTGVAAWLESLSRGWDDYVVDYNAQAQLDLLRKATRAAGSPWQALRAHVSVRALSIGLSMVVLAGLLVAWWRWRRRRAEEPHEDLLAAHLLRAAARVSGEAPSTSATVREAVEAVSWPGAAGALAGEALRAYEASRFAGQEVSTEDILRWCRQLEQVARSQR